MDSSPKGIAVIFNVLSYADTNKYPDRADNSKDISALYSLFKQIGFKTAVYRNKTSKEEAKVKLQKRAKDKNYEECDCIAVIIMSRGDEKGLVFSDGNLLPVGEVVKIVQDSPLYQGKPKLFLVQARGCTQIAAGSSSQPEQSADTNDPVSSEERAPLVLKPQPSTSNSNNDDTSALGTVKIPDLPEGDDILLSFLTLRGYVSSPSSKFDTRYIQTLSRNILQARRERRCREFADAGQLRDVPNACGKAANACHCDNFAQKTRPTSCRLF